ncbi:PREDICTED: uncharacterized protein LOC106127597 [Papilio xuthus]|uniref:Uncharacterized protein LOC106127597 n=1 Tax=Papilio xuthus TaxID=66420 RepID=A0A194Q0H7_PAPXU|nr:PREDICTED: uncharacterized protein LOC106127597 [Papilio xuthus]KPI98499.1 hypothetical protein RR46_03651 [Papilio xuthus]
MDAMESGSSEVTDHSSKNYMKVVSEPALLHDGVESETKLKPQISAPSYFHSLSENEAPPFMMPEEEDSPHILIDMLVTEDDVVRMIAVSQMESKSTFKKYLADYLGDKNLVQNFNLSEKEFLINLLLQLIEYSAQRDFNAKKLACVLAIYLTTHLYFKRYFWTAPTAVWEYFKETLIRHTIEDSPDGCEVFAPEESYDILTHFHTLYLSNIPLIHILCFGVYRLKFTWPF